jgi:hypothetical protein
VVELSFDRVFRPKFAFRAENQVDRVRIEMSDRPSTKHRRELVKHDAKKIADIRPVHPAMYFSGSRYVPQLRSELASIRPGFDLTWLRFALASICLGFDLPWLRLDLASI